MGVFTVYCIVCGGPGMDISHWVEQRRSDEPGFVFDEEEKDAEVYSWLGVQNAITPRGRWSGRCDDYGRKKLSGSIICLTIPQEWIAPRGRPAC
jgi:hypothetical protein